MNRQIRTASLLALTALLTLGLAGPAFGHAKLMQAVPRASQALHRMPRTVVLRFDEPVSVPSDGIRANAADGRNLVRSLTTGTTALVEAQLPAKLRPGKYTVRWHVVADDGHVVRGTYRFKVRPDAVAGAASAMRAPAATAPARTAGATTTILLVATLGALALALLSLVAVRRRATTVEPGSSEPRSKVALDIALIAVVGFCGLSLVGVIAGNHAGDKSAGGQQISMRTHRSPKLRRRTPASRSDQTEITHICVISVMALLCVACRRTLSSRSPTIWGASMRAGSPSRRWWAG